MSNWYCKIMPKFNDSVTKGVVVFTNFTNKVGPIDNLINSNVTFIVLMVVIIKLT